VLFVVLRWTWSRHQDPGESYNRKSPNLKAISPPAKPAVGCGPEISAAIRLFSLISYHLRKNIAFAGS
jgi:hypothetical protein